MNYSMVLYVCGLLLRFEGLFLILPFGTAILYQETEIAVAYLITIGLCFLFSFVLAFKKPKTKSIYAKDGFVIVAAGWIIMSLFGALPFTISREIPNYIDALFETISGFTTTGASILPNVELMSRGNLMWRSFTHWIGGMGVFAFIIAIMPLMGGTNMNLMKAESPGPTVSKLVPRVKDTAIALYGIYTLITVAECILLKIFGMTLFDAMTTTFGTVGTGGFGVRADSIASYSPAIQWIVTIFMIASGINFSVYFLIISKKWKDSLKIEEVRWYLGIIAVSGCVIAWNIHSMCGGWGESFRQSFFQVASIITTTGFATVNFDLWPEFSKTILIMLMFIGACASSTGGGIKVSRALIWIKSLHRELSCISHPGEVKRIRMDGKAIDEDTIRTANVYLSAYFIILLASVLLVSIDNFDFTTNFTGVLACFNNIGPGLAQVGPASNFGAYSWFSKLVLMFDMLAGRLELFPLLLFFKPGMWHKPTFLKHRGVNA